MKMRALALATCLLLAFTAGCRADGTESDATTAHKFRPGAETLPFQAEVSRLMDIIVHSLYSNKDIFLRELVSNGADALDKVRFLSITDKAILGDATAAALPLGIQISANKTRRLLTIRDTGIGMTKEDLVNNLGTIARSGTAAFIEQAQKGGDINLIGQFGVGFYSVYLVSDYVEVITKHANDKQWVWESSASGNFAVSEDTEGEPLGRGTQINIYVKEGAEEYLEEDKLRELVQRYSEFINFPISLLVEKTTEKEVPIEESEEAAEKPADEAAGTEDKKEDVAVEEEPEGEEKDAAPKTKKVTETTLEWEVLNDAKALWLRPPGDVQTEEYEGFYKALVKNEYDKPLAHTHFRAEGDVDFKAVLYVPTSPPPDMYDNYYVKKPRVKLYVRRVLVSDSFEELLPKWLSFLVGLVDSDTMPINVSREMLQMSEGIKVIRKKLVRKALEMIKRLSDDEAKAQEFDAEESKGKGWLGLGGKKPTDEEAEAAKTAIKKYADFWRSFGKAVKMGVVEDAANRRRLLPLLRFQTSASEGNLTSLDAYVSRMKENQTSIYYLVGTGGIEELKRSPFVEALVSKGYEVIYFTDPLDEYMMGNVNEYEEKTFINVSKDDVKLNEASDEADKERQKRATAFYKGLGGWWRGVIRDPSISSVRISRRLSTTPCVVVSGKWGWSATMERIAKAQALTDPHRSAAMRGKRTLEINPKHPLIKELRNKWVADPNNEALKANAKLLFETCLMESGFILDDVKAHNERVLQLLGTDMGVTDLTPVEEEEYPEVVEPEGEDKKEGIPGLEGLDLEGMGLGSGMGDDLNLGIDVKNKGNVDQATIDELLSQVRKKQLDDAEEKALKDEL